MLTRIVKKEICCINIYINIYSKVPYNISNIRSQAFITTLPIVEQPPEVVLRNCKKKGERTQSIHNHRVQLREKC